MSAERPVLVIGSGVAGLTFALTVADRTDVVVVTKKDRADSNTNYAQGGIAAVTDPGDSIADHVRDTLVAGAGLCHGPVVRSILRDGPARVAQLDDWGVAFTRAGGALSLGREGGHSRRRIVHAKDRTGREVERVLLDRVAEHPRITVLDDHLAVDLLVGTDPRRRRPRCAGALVLDEKHGRLRTVEAAITLLASGGLGRVYRHTTNPAIATGDGVAMARRAGADVANLEFVQFHPTALYPAAERAVLISEAVRGEGAVLRRRDGSDLLAGVHPLGSLAPRDIVARAIDAALKETGEDFVLLDLSAIPRDTVERRFPNIMEECLHAGIDIREAPIPVVPAAHYACGGVRTDLDGRTSLSGLLAAGEVACTGLHGANRLASNSLLEAAVVAHRAARHVLALEPAGAVDVRPADVAAPARNAPDTASAEIRAMGEALRGFMWDDVGIVRDTARLDRAAERLRELRAAARTRLASLGARPDVIELRNLVEVAALVVESARRRHESRGLHYTLDYPFRDNERFLRDTVMRGAPSWGAA